jgi:hypothetical protein
MKVGTWVQFENENKPIGYIIGKKEHKYQLRPTSKELIRTNLHELEFDVDGYATEYERKNKINRIIEFQA